MKLGSLILALLFAASQANAFTKFKVIDPEPVAGPGIFVPTEEEKAAQIAEYQKNADMGFIGGLSEVYNLKENVFSIPRIPGFISASPISDIARLVGPSSINDSYRIGDTVYFNWMSLPSPRVGLKFSFFTPAVVLQNLTNPTDFSIYLRADNIEIPKDYRMAGYFYESNGTVRITKISGGLAHGVIEEVHGQISKSDRLMPMLPKATKIRGFAGGLQVSAAVVAGSPVDRLSTTIKSFIYLNRGARDGMKPGRLLHSVEFVPMDASVMGAAPEVSSGEVVIVHVTDSYSVGMITKQFDLIRIGSLLKTKQLVNDIPPNSPFRDFAEGGKKANRQSPEIPEIPSIYEPIKDNLPDPTKARRGNIPLSDLDALEKSLKLDSLTKQEKEKLRKLSRQEKIGEESNPGAPPSELSPPSEEIRAADSRKKKKKKALKRSSDEEELNQLMMQN